MKNTFFSLLTVIALIFMAADAAQANHTSEMPAKIQAGSINETGELIHIRVNGLVCDFCARALEKVFMKRGDISGIDVDLDASRVVVSLKDKAHIDDATLRKLVTDAGYNVSGISRKPGHG